MGAYVRAWFSSLVFDSSGVCTGFCLLSCDELKSLDWILHTQHVYDVFMGAYVRAWFSSRVFDYSGVCTGFYLLSCDELKSLDWILSIFFSRFSCLAIELSRWIGFPFFSFFLFVSCDQIQSLDWISVFLSVFSFRALRSNSVAGLDFVIFFSLFVSCDQIQSLNWIS
ncbi:unnamed protein product, partial [Laminaria digitata]